MTDNLEEFERGPKPAAASKPPVVPRAVAAVRCSVYTCHNLLQSHREIICLACRNDLRRDYDGEEGAAVLLHVARTYRGAYATAEPKLGTLPERSQVRILALAASASVPLRNITGEELRWAEACRRKWPQMAWSAKFTDFAEDET